MPSTDVQRQSAYMRQSVYTDAIDTAEYRKQK